MALPPLPSALPLSLLPPASVSALRPSASSSENTTISSGATTPRRISTPSGTPHLLAPPATSTPSRPSEETPLMPLVSSPARAVTRIPSALMSVTPSCSKRKPRRRPVMPTLRLVMFQEPLDARTKKLLYIRDAWLGPRVVQNFYL